MANGNTYQFHVNLANIDDSNPPNLISLQWTLEGTATDGTGAQTEGLYFLPSPVPESTVTMPQAVTMLSSGLGANPGYTSAQQAAFQAIVDAEIAAAQAAAASQPEAVELPNPQPS